MAQATPTGYVSPQMAVEQPRLLFSEEELSGILNIVNVEEDLIEVRCGCTSKMHGDFVGILTIHRDGDLSINCQCIPGCYIENATPEEFTSHAKARLGPSQWPNCIWVHNAEGVKTKIHNTPLLDFRIAAKSFENDGHQKCKFHRDEFLKCSQCGIERRLSLRDKKDYRAIHDAVLMGSTWTCSMHPSKINCNDSHGRSRTKLFRGCPRLASCTGCIQCVCLGCTDCRFSDCGCRICVDFIDQQRIKTKPA